MINKINKSIHNRYLKFYKFFFYLRHLFAIFIVTTGLFFLIPKFFDYEKKQVLIKEHLLNDYNLELNDYKLIEYKVFPLPNLVIQEASFKIKEKPLKFKTKNLNINLRLKDIYGHKNFKSKKISFIENEMSLDIKETKKLLSYFKELKNKLDIKDLNLNIKKKEFSLIKIKNVNFSNYGYNKYIFNGEIFDKNFLFVIKENKNIEFKILDTGINADFTYKKDNFKNSIIGSSKVNILNNFLRFEFKLDTNQVEMIKSNFRNKVLSAQFNSLIKYNPYFSINSNIDINKIDEKFFKSINLEKILTENKKVIKKINSINKINYKAKKYSSDLIRSYSLNTNLAYGRLDFTNKIQILGGNIICKGDSIFIDQYPRLNFICSLKLNNPKKFLKKLSVSKNIKNDPLNIEVEGSLNIFRRKINFNKINLKNNIEANIEDKQYFKDAFEKIMYDENFFDIFKINKIKDFLIAVI